MVLCDCCCCLMLLVGLLEVKAKSKVFVIVSCRLFCFFLERKKNQKKNTISKLQKLLKKSELFLLLLFHIYSQSENIKSQLHT